MNKTTKKAIEKLGAMKLNELQAKFAEVTGETTRSPNKTLLVRRIIEAMQPAGPGAPTTKMKALVAGTATKGTGPAAAVTTTGATKTKEPAIDVAAPAGEKLSRLDLPTLQARYLEMVGRPTGSDSRGYLIWKIREAQKGRIPVGPRKIRARDGEPPGVKILPLRLETNIADKMDEAWRTHGIKNRTEFFRRALGHYLAHLGAADAAALFAKEASAGT